MNDKHPLDDAGLDRLLGNLGTPPAAQPRMGAGELMARASLLGAPAAGVAAAGGLAGGKLLGTLLLVSSLSFFGGWLVRTATPVQAELGASTVGAAVHGSVVEAPEFAAPTLVSMVWVDGVPGVPARRAGLGWQAVVEGRAPAAAGPTSRQAQGQPQRQAQGQPTVALSPGDSGPGGDRPQLADVDAGADADASAWWPDDPGEPAEEELAAVLEARREARPEVPPGEESEDPAPLALSGGAATHSSSATHTPGDPRGRLVFQVGVGAAGGLGVWGNRAPALGVTLRAGLAWQGPRLGLARPVVHFVGDGSMLPGGEDDASRFVGGLLGGAGVSLGRSRFRFSATWAGGARVMPPTLNPDGIYDEDAGWFYGVTGPEVGWSFGREDKGAFHLGLLAQAAWLDLEGTGQIQLVPWLGLTLGAELPVPGVNR